MSGGLALWSRDAASNQTIDSNAYLAEGQLAPSINNAIRGAMASMAEWRDDNAGAYDSALNTATRGASETYSFTTLQAITSLSKPFTVTVWPSADNQAPAKLSVNALTAKWIKRRTGIDLSPGDFSSSDFYTLLWLPTLDYYVVVSHDYALPGSYQRSADTTARKGWLLCNGQAVSRTAYSALFSRVGTTYGAGDGSTTFNVPDKRGRSDFGDDTMGATTAGRLTGTGGVNGTIGSVGGGQTATISIAQLPVFTVTGTVDTGGVHNHGGVTGSGGSHSHGGNTALGGGHTHTGTTGAAGTHTHDYYTPGTFNAVAQGAVGGYWNGGPNVSQTGSAGSHVHSFTVDAVGHHSHTITTDTVVAHTHTIATDAGHTHTFTSNSIGSGAGHSSMPPAMVSYDWIKG